MTVLQQQLRHEYLDFQISLVRLEKDEISAKSVLRPTLAWTLSHQMEKGEDSYSPVVPTAVAILSH